MDTVTIPKQDFEAARVELSPDALNEYVNYRAAGSSHNFALMCAARQAPGQVCTDERWAGENSGKGKYQHGFVRKQFKGKTDKEIHEGKGDPMAYVSSRAEAERRANQLGLVITGNAPRGIRTVSHKTPAEPKTKASDELKTDPKFRAAMHKFAKQLQETA